MQSAKQALFVQEASLLCKHAWALLLRQHNVSATILFKLCYILCLHAKIGLMYDLHQRTAYVGLNAWSYYQLFSLSRQVAHKHCQVAI
jgi:hypothetical protein